MYRFVLGETGSMRSAAAYKRVGKAKWLNDAVSGGWLQRIELWADGPFVELVAGWKKPAADVPLLVTAAPQIDDAGVAAILKLPQVIALDLTDRPIRDLSLTAEPSWPKLQELTLNLAHADATLTDALLDQVAALPRLHNLTLIGHSSAEKYPRPNSATLERLAKSSSLKRLRISAAPALTKESLVAFTERYPAIRTVMQ